MEISLKIVKHMGALALVLISFPIVCARSFHGGSRFATNKSSEANPPGSRKDRAFNTEKAILETKKLCKEFISPTEDFTYSVDEINGFERTGKRLTFSIVSCTAADQLQAATFRWDASAGSLCSFDVYSSHLETKYPQLSYNAKSMPYSKAVELGESCLARLMSTEQAIGEKFVLQTLEKNAFAWNANYRSSRKKIQVSLNSHTGDLIEVKLSNSVAAN